MRKNMDKNLNNEVWGPHYWFFLRTICIIYPNYPNSIVKKKYYDFFMNFLPLFLPNEEAIKKYTELLYLYPVSPYLDNRESLVRWLWFINNKINEHLRKPKIKIQDFYIEYYNLYKDADDKKNSLFLRKIKKHTKQIVYFIILGILIFACYYFYNL